jgi:hypothetical protein
MAKISKFSELADRGEDQTAAAGRSGDPSEHAPAPVGVVVEVLDGERDRHRSDCGEAAIDGVGTSTRAVGADAAGGQGHGSDDGGRARHDVNAPEPDPEEHQGPLDEPGADEDALEHGVE